MSLNDPNVIPLADVVYAARQEARDAEFEGRHEDTANSTRNTNH